MHRRSKLWLKQGAVITHVIICSEVCDEHSESDDGRELGRNRAAEGNLRSCLEIRFEDSSPSSFAANLRVWEVT